MIEDQELEMIVAVSQVAKALLREQEHRWREAEQLRDEQELGTLWD